jgi:HSP20 family protein
MFSDLWYFRCPERVLNVNKYFDVFESDVYTKYKIEEKDNQLTLKMEIPGFDKDQINIEINNNILAIYTVAKEQRKLVKKWELTKEFDQDSVSAELKNGILSIVLQKKPAAKTRTIAINQLDNSNTPPCSSGSRFGCFG